MVTRRMWLSGMIAAGTQCFPSAETYYPHPRYVPEGYRLTSHWTDRSDGFGGGPAEIATIYVNPRYARGFSNGLAIFVSPTPKKALSFTEYHEPKTIHLQMATGGSVTASYWDGWWQPKPDGEFTHQNVRLTWDRSNIHALVFKVGGNTIGIRACRMGGVTYEELLRVAGSIE